jgi:YEATS domain-containing protein 4
MPSATQNRRVKTKRITRPFLIGTEAWKLNDSNRPRTIKPGDTTGWRVYVRPVPNGPDIRPWLKKVVFVLHETFPNPVRTIENYPFELEESGYGGFIILVKLYFQPIASEKQQQRSHFLQLDPYGDEAMMAEQAKLGMVRSEVVEFIEFNEPTEGLWDELTSENQWNYLMSGGRGSKGKSQTLAPMNYRTIELPDKPQPNGSSVYCRETEEAMLDALNKAMKKCDEETAEVLKKSKEINDELANVKEGTDIDAKLLELHEKIPPKKK